MQKVGDVLKKFKIEEDKYISREFQQYGYDLAEELGDLKSTSLYIKLAQETPRGLLEAARSFVKDATNIKNRTALFMWKLQQLRVEAKNKKK
ncbi:hypothetical protein HY502_02310 [Candidatus Woesebacteria bacterium]|nr:hypothetical protein [Candidatus Woesebacteria bacterium]